jgi:hypothetical protein
MWVIYGYLIDALIRWYRDYRTRNWPTAKGQVESTRVSGASVVLTYSYTVDNHRLTGIHDRSCVDRTSADDYAKRFIPKWSLVIRYNGADPANSVVVEDDQSIPPVWATRYRED